MRNTAWHSLLRIPTGEGRRKSVDLALQTSVLGVKTLHSTAEVLDDRVIEITEGPLYYTWASFEIREAF